MPVGGLYLDNFVDGLVYRVGPVKLIDVVKLHPFGPSDPIIESRWILKELSIHIMATNPFFKKNKCNKSVLLVLF